MTAAFLAGLGWTPERIGKARLRAPRPAASAPPQPAESTTPRVDEPQRGDGGVVIPATSPPATDQEKAPALSDQPGA